MNKIHIIDLLNKKANGEEVPKKIKKGNNIYIYDNDWSYYRLENIWGGYSLQFNLDNLNDEIEIIKEVKFSYNYILNDMALSSLITRCLYSDSANSQDKYDLEHQIELLQQENKQLKERTNKAIEELKESQKGLEEWHFDGYDPCLEDIIEILKGDSNE